MASHPIQPEQVKCKGDNSCMLCTCSYFGCCMLDIAAQAALCMNWFIEVLVLTCIVKSSSAVSASYRWLHLQSAATSASCKAFVCVVAVAEGCKSSRTLAGTQAETPDPCMHCMPWQPLYCAAACMAPSIVPVAWLSCPTMQCCTTTLLVFQSTGPYGTCTGWLSITERFG
jgi:hypothetical protein